VREQPGGTGLVLIDGAVDEIVIAAKGYDVFQVNVCLGLKLTFIGYLLLSEEAFLTGNKFLFLVAFMAFEGLLKKLDFLD